MSKRDREDNAVPESAIDEMIEESFPASDPPSFNPSQATPTEPGVDAAEAAHTVAELVRGELAATDAYRIAVARVGTPHRERLQDLMREHAAALDALSAELKRTPAEPMEAGRVTRGVHRLAAFLGARASLRALRASESRGVRRYQLALAGNSLPCRIRKRVADDLLPRQTARLRMLDAMLDA